MCFICEQSPLTGAIDTLRTFQTHVPTKLTGRKYICIECAKELGYYAGLVSGQEVVLREELLRACEFELIEAQKRVAELEALKVETLEGLLSQVIEKPKSVPRAKPKAASAE